MNIYLVRHGETSWNREERLQGLTDVPLNRFGVRQAQRLVPWLRKTNVATVVSSPLGRARRTAGILCAATYCPVVIDSRLCEIDHGPWAGCKISDLARRFPDAFATWRFSPDKLAMTACETLEAAYRRSSGVLCELVAANLSADVLIVSHGVTNALLVCAALGVPLSEIGRLPQGNGRVTMMKVIRSQITAVETEINVAA
jgi:phosphoserine phosphatase